MNLKLKIMTYSNNYDLKMLSLKLVFITFILIPLKHVLMTSCYFSLWQEQASIQEISKAVIKSLPTFSSLKVTFSSRKWEDGVRASRSWMMCEFNEQRRLGSGHGSHPLTQLEHKWTRVRKSNLRRNESVFVLNRWREAIQRKKHFRGDRRGRKCGTQLPAWPFQPINKSWSRQEFWQLHRRWTSGERRSCFWIMNDLFTV